MFSVTSITSSCGSTLLNAFKASACALSAAFTTPVRYRYHEDKPAILQRRWGYEDKVAFRGLLPRVQTSKKLPMPPYVPKNSWAERRALFGQNDYVDILGDDESILPIKFAYGVPSWLRGFRGSEYQMLLRKRAVFGRLTDPKNDLVYNAFFVRKRLKFLYRRINRKTKHFMDIKVMHR
ncbi:39S ribosomal protein L51, mitochondrial [Orchesella cincta]|uniref:Large ribosomal subunit protein mL51 n=1 Tax=Orchesella cincta TaxID=48709 RepID=A0A1D2NGV6_ORCCI|nr:39S ribosomal protein L51, mitochondrial [Orchesella cincta]